MAPSWPEGVPARRCSRSVCGESPVQTSGKPGWMTQDYLWMAHIATPGGEEGSYLGFAACWQLPLPLPPAISHQPPPCPHCPRTSTTSVQAGNMHLDTGCHPAEVPHYICPSPIWQKCPRQPGGKAKQAQNPCHPKFKHFLKKCVFELAPSASIFNHIARMSICCSPTSRAQGWATTAAPEQPPNFCSPQWGTTKHPHAPTHRD